MRGIEIRILRGPSFRLIASLCSRHGTETTVRKRLSLMPSALLSAEFASNELLSTPLEVGGDPASSKGRS
jgi:hypothetical protein